MDPEIGFRYVTCYCGKSQVVTRRDPVFDRFAVCSMACYNEMVQQGKQEPGSLLREVR